MEKLADFVINGGVKMPIGYRFHPTDEELVIHYLKRKVHAAPLPASVIPDFDVFQAHPWALPGDVREKRYFFHNQGNDPIDNKGGNCKRAAGCGYWKPTGRKEKQIVASDETKEVVGMRKTLVYCPRKRSYHHHVHGTKSRWFMHQFRLLLPCSDHKTNSWIVYRVFQKKRKPQPTSDVGINQRVLNVMVDPLEYISRLQVVLPSVPSSSSCSSDITEVSSNTANDDEEHNSSATINTSYP